MEADENRRGDREVGDVEWRGKSIEHKARLCIDPKAAHGEHMEYVLNKNGCPPNPTEQYCPTSTAMFLPVEVVPSTTQ